MGWRYIEQIRPGDRFMSGVRSVEVLGVNDLGDGRIELDTDAGVVVAFEDGDVLLVDEVAS